MMIYVMVYCIYTAFSSFIAMFNGDMPDNVRIAGFLIALAGTVAAIGAGGAI